MAAESVPNGKQRSPIQSSCSMAAGPDLDPSRLSLNAEVTCHLGARHSPGAFWNSKNYSSSQFPSARPSSISIHTEEHAAERTHHRVETDARLGLRSASARTFR